MTSATTTNLNRSHSFVNALKWWPLQGHNHQSNNAAASANGSGGTGGGGGGGGGGGSVVGGGASTASGLSLLAHLHSKTATFGSSVAVQKLRESKWFKRDEQRIFCAVVECGFIVEVRSANTNNSTTNKRTMRSNSSGSGGSGVDEYDVDDDNDDEDEVALKLSLRTQDENETPMTSWFGIVLCKTAKDNKPKPETIEVFTVKIRENGTFKMVKLTLEDIWNQGWELRINNFADKEKSAHNEKDIRNQVSFARKARHSLWNNNKHFVYWCRYGSRQQDVRKRQMSECVKWGSVGMNAGMLLLMNKQKSYSTSK
ncbi:PREDICTED: uncharacterized protein LOC108365957 [Rhagoletis zephyria]|uniref:uncharacterized protein LOC108365957 n=1 Tax=Rhagoletis zephyria TaxID=28612 RepID=UPI0008116075|nr:PREDICTED: uncharacterized protein LOC108365957 [Rhagoletis zephyria]